VPGSVGTPPFDTNTGSIDAPAPSEAENRLAQEIASDTKLPTSQYVQSGDTLSEIAESQLKAAGIPYDYTIIDDYVELLAEKNDITDKHSISAGMKIDFVTLPEPQSIVTPEQTAKAMMEVTSVNTDGCTESLQAALADNITPQAQAIKDQLENSIVKSFETPPTYEQVASVRGLRI
jgi:hypothetical protein